jgi:ubiquinone/menaquinone biosynthesis C-methylase UbiE
MARPTRRLIVIALVIAGVVAVIHRARSQATPTDRGVLIADAPLYDRLTGWLLGSFYTGIANDVAVAAGPGARVLDVGCGPGHLVERLVDQGMTVSGIDLDPAMIERARQRIGSRAELVAADAAFLPFADGIFDLVVSTLSMHHWADHQGGLAEIGRVLAPGGRVLVFDFGGAHVPLHGHVHGPAHHVEGSVFELVADTRWRWPGPLSRVRRVEARQPT